MTEVAKLVKEFKQEVREKAIDEFAEEISVYGIYDYYGNKIDVFKIADQLKGGEK